MEPFETPDNRFARYAIRIVFLEKPHAGLRWAQGPVYFADERCLLFSDLPNNRILRIDEQTSQVTVFRADSHFSNGNTRNRRHVRASRPSRDSLRVDDRPGIHF